MLVRTKKNRLVNVFPQDAGLFAVLEDMDGFTRVIEEPKELPEHLVTWGIEIGSISGAPSVVVSCSRGAHDIVAGRLERYAFKHCGESAEIPGEILERYNAGGVVINADGAEFLG